MITVKLYLKSKKRAIILKFNKRSQYEDYMEKLQLSDIIDIGVFAFAKTEFRYQIVSEKKSELSKKN